MMLNCVGEDSWGFPGLQADPNQSILSGTVLRVPGRPMKPKSNTWPQQKMIHWKRPDAESGRAAGEDADARGWGYWINPDQWDKSLANPEAGDNKGMACWRNSWGLKEVRHNWARNWVTTVWLLDRITNGRGKKCIMSRQLPILVSISLATDWFRNRLVLKY